MNNTAIVNSTRPRDYKLNGRGKVIITEDLSAQIDALHAAHPGNEWSGVLVIEPINDNITKPDEVILKALAVYPMDFGSPGYTEYTLDEEVLKIYEAFPDADPALHEQPRLKFAQIHTHHGMSAFFSGVDESELRTNAGKYDYYLSLIVNLSGNYVAKVAFPAEIPQAVSYKDKKTKEVKTIERPPLEVLAMFDVDVEFERTPRPLDTWFTDKLNELKRSPKKHYTINEHASSTSSYRPYGSYGHLNYSSKGHGGVDMEDDNYWKGYDNRSGYESGLFGSKKEEEKEKRKETSSIEDSIANSVDGPRLRTTLPFLFLEDEEKAKATTLFLYLENHPLKNAGIPAVTSYANALVSRVDKWLDTYFGDEIIATNGTIEKYILEQAIEKIDMASFQNPLADAVKTALKGHIKEHYNG